MDAVGAGYVVSVGCARRAQDAGGGAVVGVEWSEGAGAGRDVGDYWEAKARRTRCTTNTGKVQSLQLEQWAWTAWQG